MSAAATAADYLYASGKLRGAHGKKDRRKHEAERAAEDLKRERETNLSTAPKGAQRRS